MKSRLIFLILQYEQMAAKFCLSNKYCVVDIFTGGCADAGDCFADGELSGGSGSDGESG